MIFNHFNVLVNIEGFPCTQRMVERLGLPSEVQKMPSGKLFVSYIFRHRRFNERIRFDLWERDGSIEYCNGYKESRDAIHGTWDYKGKVDVNTVEAWCCAVSAYSNAYDVRKVRACVSVQGEKA